MTPNAIKPAIEELAEEEKRALVDWLLALDREKWVEEISEDFSAGGRGMKMLDEADAAVDPGEFKPLG
ncbi:MAG: hypothetical protein ACRD2B_00050 [Terriglobia bacterium]